MRKLHGSCRCKNEKPFRITRNGVFQPGDTSCLGRKGFAATTTLAGVWIGNLETASGQTITEIDDGSANVLRAEGINQHRYPMHFTREVVRPLFVKNHRVLHPRTPALLYIDSQYLAAIFGLAQQGFYFFGRAGSQVDDWFVGGFYLHNYTPKPNSVNGSCQITRRFYSRLLDTATRGAALLLLLGDTSQVAFAILNFVLYRRQ